MLRSRIFWKLLLAFSALNLIAAVSLVRITLGWLEEGAVGHAESDLSGATLLLAEAFADDLPTPGPDAAARLARLSNASGVRYTLLGPEGDVLADSSDATGGDEINSEIGGDATRFASQPDVVAALRSGVGFAPNAGPDDGPPIAAASRRVRRDGRVVGVVRATAVLTETEDRAAALRGRYLYFAIGIGVVMLGVTYAIVRHIATPVVTLSRAADAIAAGDYTQRAFVANNDELGALASSFNRMSQELGAQLTELREGGQRQATVLGGMIEGVIAIDERQRVLFANAAAGRLFDFTPPQVEGRPLLEVVRHYALSKAVGVGLSSGRPQRLEVEWEGAERLTLSTQVTPLPGDPCPGAVVVLHDTTELRRLETLRREFVANVSHELKTPLSSIKAYAETLINGALHDEKHSIDFLRRIEEQSDRLNNLIQDMLSLARIESAQQPFDIARIVVADIADACIEDYQPQAEAKRITLSAEGSPPT
ncbi:MAG: histidine kinase dimerization/phospho-acceptor domain-containing protein, partial [Planctomycetota bacterium]